MAFIKFCLLWMILSNRFNCGGSNGKATEITTRCCHLDSNTHMEVFGPEYETYSDIVTNKKVAQSNQKWKGCQIILYFTFRHPTKKLRERERKIEREERERKNVRSLRGYGCRTGGKVLMSLFLINIIHVVIIIIRFRHPAPLRKSQERETERERAAEPVEKVLMSLFFM